MTFKIMNIFKDLQKDLVKEKILKNVNNSRHVNRL